MNRSIRTKPPVADRTAVDATLAARQAAPTASRTMRGRSPAADARIARADRLGHRVTTAPLGAVQAKLSVGPVDDAYEREADQTARAVVDHIKQAPASVEATDAVAAGGVAANSPVRRDADLEDEEIFRMPDTLLDEEEAIQTKRIARQPTQGSGPEGGAVSADVEQSIDQTRSGGRSLDGDIRHDMESAFDVDFGDVRVHTDDRSDALNRSLQARAFTTGRDVYFSQGNYQPRSDQGRELLAHELTHVVQQVGAKPRSDAS